MAFHNVPPNGFPDIPDIEDLEAVQGDITALKTGKTPKTDIAAEFSATTNYAVGDLVYKDGVLYECTTAHEAAAWAAGDFTAASVGSVASSLMSGLTNYENQNNINLMVADRVNLWACGDLNTASESNLPIDLLAGQYTLKCTMSNTSSALTLRFNYTDGTSKLVQNIAHNTAEIFTLDKRVSSVNTSISSFTEGDTITNIMLNAGNTALTFAPYIPSVESRIEAVEKGLVSYDMSNWNDYPDFVGKYAVVGKVLFFSLKVTKADSSWNLAGIANRQVLINGACVAYDNANNAQIIATNTSGSIVLQIQDTDTFTNPTNVSGCFLLA